MKKLGMSLILMGALGMSSLAVAQDRNDRDRDRNNNTTMDRDHDNQARDAERQRYSANDAAYQDGWNRGMMDGQKHHKAKIKYGHWKKNSQDREAYSAAYNRAYQQYYSANNNNRRDRDHDRNNDHDNNRDHDMNNQR